MIVDLVARLRAENARLRERVAELEVDVFAAKSVAATYAELLDEARGIPARVPAVLRLVQPNK